MAASKKTSIRPAGRPKKHVGLSPVMQKKVTDGDAVRDLQPVEPVGEGSVLPDTRPTDPQAAGKVRVFRTPDHQHDQRVSPAAKPSPFPHAERPDADEVKINALFKRVIAEVAAARFQEDETRLMSNAEVLVRAIVDSALGGRADAQEVVLDRVEGKPVRANQVQSADSTIEDQIDRASVAHLNSFAQKKAE